jgi:hypothetical protein
MAGSLGATKAEASKGAGMEGFGTEIIGTIADNHIELTTINNSAIMEKSQTLWEFNLLRVKYNAILIKKLLQAKVLRFTWGRLQGTLCSLTTRP